MFYSVQKRGAAARVGLQEKQRRESRNTLAARFCYTLLQTKTLRRFALLQPLGNVATAACLVKPMGAAVHIPPVLRNYWRRALLRRFSDKLLPVRRCRCEPRISRSCCNVHAAVGCGVTLTCNSRREPCSIITKT